MTILASVEHPTTDRPRRPQGGPPLFAPALASGVLMVTAVLLSLHTPDLSAPGSSVLAYDRSHHDALEVAGCLTFAAALPLAIWSATAYRRLRTLGVAAPGAVIALAGGLLAAASVALSGLISWTSAQLPASADPSVARVLGDLAFATGAAGFVAPLGLLVAGVAVPSLILHLAPRAVAWIGLVVAGLSELSTFTLLTSALDFTLPVGRFGGLVWLLAMSFLLPASRQALRRRTASAAAA